MSAARGGVLERLRAALTASPAQLDAQDELRERLADTTPIEDLVPRARTRVGGILSAVTYPPAGQAPLLRARLFDGTGTVELVFLGRRSVPGIEPGRRLRADGTPVNEGHGPVMYNPAIELVVLGEDDIAVSGGRGESQ